MDISRLRRLLGESDRDVAALSREEADRIVAIPDLDRRLRAYMGLREVWAYGGDRLLPEDDARIQASFADSGVAAALAPPPAPPPAALPLTPLSLLGWAERWRGALVASAIQRGKAAGGPHDAGELEALAATRAGQPGLYLPELALLRQLDALIAELREGLEARQLLPGEALPGDIENLPALLKAAAAARARREIPVPQVPALPGQRCTVDALLGWLEALLLFEESVGARALLQAGVATEPGEARARFLAAARGEAPDVAGHAAAQLGSWRRAEAVHRAVDVALGGRWLTRDRAVVLPGFEVRDLETFFLAFAGGVPAPLPADGVTTPEAVAQWWTHRRAAAVRSMALHLLAEGVLQGTANLEARTEELVVRGLVQALPELGVLAEADRVLAACRAVQALDAPVGAVEDGTHAGIVLRAWGAYLPRPSAPAPAPAPAVAAPAPMAPAPAEPAPAAGAAPGLFPVRVAVAARARLPSSAPPGPAGGEAATVSAPPDVAPEPVAEEPPAPAPHRRDWDTVRASAARVAGRLRLPLLLLGGVAVYQAGALALAALGGPMALQTSLALRLARLGDPWWLAQGALLLGAFVLVATGTRRLPRTGRQWGRAGLAAALVAASFAMPVPLRFAASAEGFAAWPERVVVRGGVPVSTLVPSEGVWLRGVALAPVLAEDPPVVEPGAPALALLREVGPFGRHQRWLLANRADVEAMLGTSLENAPRAPGAAMRRENVR